MRVRADLNPDAIDNADHDDGDQDPPNPPQNAQNVVIPPAAPGAAQTTLAFKVEQSKIPEYFGQNERIISRQLFSSGRLMIWLTRINGTT